MPKNYIPLLKTLFTNWLVVWKMTWGIWQIFCRALKIGILMGFFNPKLKRYELKIQRNHLSWLWRTTQNLKRKWLVISKLTWGIWQILTWALESLKSSILMCSFWVKYILFELKKVQRSYLSWNWRGMQNLERNRLVISKLAWGIWQILTWALKSLKTFHFNSLLLSKIYITWTKKEERSYFAWHWRVMQNLKKNWFIAWKMTWGIWQIFTKALESVKTGTLMGSFCPK